MTARKLAFKILMDVEVNKNYSNLSLNKFLRESELDDRDKSLVTEIVYGVIEKKRYIDYMINKVSKMKVKKMNHSVKAALRIGVYQMFWLDSVADYACINETVNLVGKRDKKTSGFVNAILRNISREKDKISKIDEKNIADIAIKYSFEDWIVDKIASEHGLERAKDIIKSLAEKPKMYVRVNLTKKAEYGFEDEASFVIYVREKLKEMNIDSKTTPLLEGLVVEGLRNIESNELFRKGIISIQDVSSMMVANVVSPKENTKVLDLCAAPGGKTTHIAEKLNQTGEVVSCDVFKHKIKLIESYTQRLGLKNVSVIENDALKENDNFIDEFDYVLVDAPCSGMGIVRRKPEIKYKKEDEISSLPEIQLNILKNASKYVKVGGNLVYSTCTIFNDENMGVIMRFLMENDEFFLDSIDNIDIFKEDGESGYITIYPDKYDMDGFFICKLKRK